MTDKETISTLTEILGAERADALLAHWRKTAPGDLEYDTEHLDLLRVAGIIMAGQQRPSVITAVSTASSLQSSPAWNGLVYLAMSLESFSEVQALQPSIEILVQQTVVAAQEEIARCLEHASINAAQTLRRTA